jgi:hypothetical protein
MNSSSRWRVAVIGAGNALHQFHHEIGPAGVGRATVEGASDVGVLHHRQRLALGIGFHRFVSVDLTVIHTCAVEPGFPSIIIRKFISS